MKRKSRPAIESKPLSRAPARMPAEPDESGASIDDDDRIGERVITRPDGHHWLSLDGRREFGPFNSFEEALVDMQTDDEESAAEPGETLQEAEFEIGMTDWIDPDTGEPAEGQSTPRLHDE